MKALDADIKASKKVSGKFRWQIPIVSGSPVPAEHSRSSYI